MFSSFFNAPRGAIHESDSFQFMRRSVPQFMKSKDFNSFFHELSDMNVVDMNCSYEHELSFGHELATP